MLKHMVLSQKNADRNRKCMHTAAHTHTDMSRARLAADSLRLVRRRRIRISIEIFKAVTGRKRPPATDKDQRRGANKTIAGSRSGLDDDNSAYPACAEPTET
ncbi:hypothetical protein EVAR_55048_1 [Eumeta japonica]|uniref:Uncharacterized protein n=1 Tax=Eumeta variegata TaxID=151549 RepID=A0A4C1ZT61_EUMVA|nr:hypothetical protein EVAR_55048_1 [Eumeta japonica]